jgi:hypothetical protein
MGAIYNRRISGAGSSAALRRGGANLREVPLTLRQKMGAATLMLSVVSIRRLLPMEALRDPEGR